MYLPHYISVWDPTQFTFYGVVIAMIRVFSVEPPVNSRPTAASPSADEPERRQLISNLAKRLSVRLNDVNEEATQEIATLLYRKDQLIKSDKSMSEEMRQKATAYKSAEEELELTKNRVKDLDDWVKDFGSVKEDDHIDERLRYKDILDEQIVDCTSHDAAYTDALDRVDEAFVQGVIDQEKYLKDIRRLSREQFFHRALRRKIEITASKKPPGDPDGATPRRLASTRITPMYAS